MRPLETIVSHIFSDSSSSVNDTSSSRRPCVRFLVIDVNNKMPMSTSFQKISNNLVIKHSQLYLVDSSLFAHAQLVLACQLRLQAENN